MSYHKYYLFFNGDAMKSMGFFVFWLKNLQKAFFEFSVPNKKCLSEKKPGNILK